MVTPTPKNLCCCILLLLQMTGCSSQSKLISDSMLAVTEEKLDYFLYYPEGYEDNTDETFGLLLFLHGGGEAGGGLDDLAKNGPPKMLIDGTQFPFLVLVPQNPHKKMWWNTHAVIELLDKVVTESKVDESRIYLSGLSRGGGAAWELVTQYPKKFAALAVVCGMTPLPYAHWVDKKLPIWVFHGAKDEIIPVSESDEMVKTLKDSGYTVKYTRYDNLGHNVWDKAYQNPELYDWLAAQSR